MRTQCPKLPRGSQYHKVRIKTNKMSDKTLKNVDKVMTIICSVGLILALSIVLTSCGTTRGGGCGGSPKHLGN